MKRARVLSLATGAAGIAAGVPLQGPAQELRSIKFGDLKITSDAPLWIADRLGYFRAEGLKVEFFQFQSSETMMPLLATGGLDAASGAAASSLYNAVIHGVDVRAVADAASDPPGYGISPLFVRTDLVKSGRFKTIADLRGMTVAGAAVASASAIQLSHLLAKAGLTIADIKRVALPYSQHLVAFKNGAVDASLTIEPFATLLADSGAAVKIMGNDQFYPNQQISMILFSGTFVKAHRDLGLHFVRAYLRGVRYYNDALANGKIAGPNADTVLKILVDETGGQRSLFERATPIPMNPNGHLNRASMRDDLAFYRSQGFIEGPVTTDAIVDDWFVDQALRELGPYKPARSRSSSVQP
jgi:NitT/TauT family transport system substrate-binding protein